MDLVLLAHLKNIEKNSPNHTWYNGGRIEYDFAVADALDYLGDQIDQEKRRTPNVPS
jgi:hypothetical protein